MGANGQTSVSTNHVPTAGSGANQTTGFGIASASDPPARNNRKRTSGAISSSSVLNPMDQRLPATPSAASGKTTASTTRARLSQAIRRCGSPCNGVPGTVRGSGEPGKDDRDERRQRGRPQRYRRRAWIGGRGDLGVPGQDQPAVCQSEDKQVDRYGQGSFARPWTGPTRSCGHCPGPQPALRSAQKEDAYPDGASEPCGWRQWHAASRGRDRSRRVLASGSAGTPCPCPGRPAVRQRPRGRPRAAGRS